MSALMVAVMVLGCVAWTGFFVGRNGAAFRFQNLAAHYCTARSPHRTTDDDNETRRCTCDFVSARAGANQVLRSDENCREEWQHHRRPRQRPQLPPTRRHHQSVPKRSLWRPSRGSITLRSSERSTAASRRMPTGRACCRCERRCLLVTLTWSRCCGVRAPTRTRSRRAR